LFFSFFVTVYVAQCIPNAIPGVPGASVSLWNPGFCQISSVVFNASTTITGYAIQPRTSLAFNFVIYSDSMGKPSQIVWKHQNTLPGANGWSCVDNVASIPITTPTRLWFGLCTTAQIRAGEYIADKFESYFSGVVQQTFVSIGRFPTGSFPAAGILTNNNQMCTNKNCFDCITTTGCSWCLEKKACGLQNQSCRNPTHDLRRCHCEDVHGCGDCTKTQSYCYWCDKDSPLSNCRNQSTSSGDCETVVRDPQYCDKKKKRNVQ